MSISSVSRVYDAPDPIMETDLELLGKVNTFQQAKYDVGAATMQNEINNWAMMADVSKPQDREYINAKLNNLVSRINGLGGVDLSDANNVNTLKSLGYNIYGDQKIVNAVATTKKYKGFLNDGATKLSGKNAKDYDSVFFEHQQSKWNNWLADEQVGTTYDGPTQLNPGSFENYTKKIQDEVSKLTPDAESLPQGAGEALNYVQVNNKFIKKERIKALIDSVTTAQDRQIMNAHAWKNMGGMVDQDVVKMVDAGIDYQIKDLQKQKSDIKHWSEQSTDFEQKKRYESQIAMLDNAIRETAAQKQTLRTETTNGLKPDVRENLMGGLYFNAYKEGYATSKAFEQNSQTLKSNEARMFQIKEARQAYEFGIEMSFKKEALESNQQLELLKMAAAAGDASALAKLGIGGPAGNAPLAIVDVQGDDTPNLVNQKGVEAANANYIGTASAFYKEAYNTLGALPGYQNYVVKNADGFYVPKDEASKAILDKAVETKVSQFDNIGLVPVDQRKQFEENLTAEDKELMQYYDNVKEAALYKEQMAQVEDQAFQNKGLQSPRQKQVQIPLYDGRTVSVSLSELKNMEKAAINNPGSKEAATFNDWKVKAKDSGYRSDNTIGGDIKELFKTDLSISRALGNKTYLDNAIETANDYYGKADWESVSKTLNPYGRNVTLPKNNKGKVNETYTAYLATAVRNQASKDVAAQVKQDDIDLNKVYVKYDASNSGSKARYMAEVMYRKGDSKEGDQYVTVDLTDDVINNPNSFISKIFPQDNSEIIYGFMLSKDGKTPFSASDNYSSALQTSSYAPYSTKYQIVAQKNQKSGLESFKVNMLVPYTKEDGAVGYNTVPVKNTYNNFSFDFPANFKSVNDYMNQKFGSKEKALEFYQIHGINLK